MCMCMRMCMCVYKCMCICLRLPAHKYSGSVTVAHTLVRTTPHATDLLSSVAPLLTLLARCSKVPHNLGNFATVAGALRESIITVSFARISLDVCLQARNACPRNVRASAINEHPMLTFDAHCRGPSSTHLRKDLCVLTKDVRGAADNRCACSCLVP
jgi:hypothetical protein